MSHCDKKLDLNWSQIWTVGNGFLVFSHAFFRPPIFRRIMSDCQRCQFRLHKACIYLLRQERTYKEYNVGFSWHDVVNASLTAQYCSLLKDTTFKNFPVKLQNELRQMVPPVAVVVATTRVERLVHFPVFRVPPTGTHLPITIPEIQAIPSGASTTRIFLGCRSQLPSTTWIEWLRLQKGIGVQRQSAVKCSTILGPSRALKRYRTVWSNALETTFACCCSAVFRALANLRWYKSNLNASSSARSELESGSSSKAFKFWSISRATY